MRGRSEHPVTRRPGRPACLPHGCLPQSWAPDFIKESRVLKDSAPRVPQIGPLPRGSLHQEDKCLPLQADQMACGEILSPASPRPDSFRAGSLRSALGTLQSDCLLTPQEEGCTGRTEGRMDSRAAEPQQGEGWHPGSGRRLSPPASTWPHLLLGHKPEQPCSRQAECGGGGGRRTFYTMHVGHFSRIPPSLPCDSSQWSFTLEDLRPYL